MRNLIKIFVLTFLFHANLAVCQSKEIVIEKFIKAMGGREKWLTIRTEIDSGMIYRV